MGFNVFSDDWDRLRSGDLYLSDCTGLDRRLDRQLIEYIAIHGRGWWMPKFRRRYRIGETFPGPADGAGPDEGWSRYCVIREQAARENDSEVLKKAAFRDDVTGRFAFCRLTGYSWGDRTDDNSYTYWCGLKSDVLREDIEDFCRQMIEKEGPFAFEAGEWLAGLQEVPDEELDEWAEGQTERKPYHNLSDRTEKLLKPCGDSSWSSEEERAGKIRSIFDAYIMMVYEEGYGKVSRSRKYRLMDPFTYNIYEILKQMDRRMITDEADAVIAVLCSGRAMGNDLTREWIRETVRAGDGSDSQHGYFLGLADRCGLCSAL